MSRLFRGKILYYSEGGRGGFLGGTEVLLGVVWGLITIVSDMVRIMSSASKVNFIWDMIIF